MTLPSLDMPDVATQWKQRTASAIQSSVAVPPDPAIDSVNGTSTASQTAATTRPIIMPLQHVRSDSNNNQQVHPSVHLDALGKQLSPRTPRVALITGITGQDGSYLSELLLEKGYVVHGIIRRSSAFNTTRIEHLYRDPHLTDVRLFLHYGDLTDSSNLCQIIANVRPDEVYNLAAMSHVKVSFEMSEYTADVDAIGALRLLNCLRTCGLAATTRFYQASTSELFGKIQQCPQNEQTPFYPRSPYGVAKQFAYWSVVNYREAYNMFAVNGILFNHESPRRGPTFVTRKITRAVVRIRAGVDACLFVGNLDAKRDWGHARDYVECMWRMLQTTTPQDFVVATGECHSVREFVELAFARVDIKLRWTGARGSIDECGVDAGDNESHRVVVRIDPQYFRPTEVDVLIGDASKAKAELAWEPRVRFRDLVHEMVDADAAVLATHPGGSHHVQ